MSVVTLEFLRAAALGDINRLRALLAQGVDINTTNKANQTALMLAAAFKQTEIVKFLLTAGANVNCHDELGLTATDWAQQQAEIIQLINSGEGLRASADDLNTTPVVQTSPQERAHSEASSSTELGSVILRANKRYAQTVSPDLAATAAARAPITAELEIDETVDAPKPASAELTEDTVAPAAASPKISASAASETLKPASRVDIVLPQRPHTRSPVVRQLFRVGIVLSLLIVGFVTYHLATRKVNVVQLEPTTIPVRAAPKPKKSAPVVGGDLAGAELYIADAEYPPDATVESGNVTVGVQVSKKGIVVSAKAVDGDESLRSTAEKAARGSAFIPDKLQDRGSLINGTITYNFLKTADRAAHRDEFGFSDETPTQVVATAGGPLAGAERKLEIPPVPSKLHVGKGTVTVVVRVSRSGRVLSWRPLNADSRLRPWMIKGARSSTFDPSKLPGEGDVVGTITYRFQ
jgi:hypothetical protein